MGVLTSSFTVRRKTAGSPTTPTNSSTPSSLMRSTSRSLSEPTTTSVSLKTVLTTLSLVRPLISPPFNSLAHPTDLATESNLTRPTDVCPPEATHTVGTKLIWETCDANSAYQEFCWDKKDLASRRSLR